MEWLIYSAFMFVFSVFQYLLIRKLQLEKVDNKIIQFFMFAPGVPVLAGFMLVNNISFAIQFKYIVTMIVAIYFFSYLGNKYSLLGTQLAPNPGFSLIIQKSYAIYTAFAAVLLFNSRLSAVNLLAVVLIIFFLGVILYEKQKTARTASKKWIIYSVLAFFMFGNLALVSKYWLNEGLNPVMTTFYTFLIVSLMFGLEAFPARKQIRLQKKHFILMLVLIGISNGAFNTFMRLGFQTAPNIGYVNIINASSISAITILAAVFFKDRLNLQKIIGVFGVIGGLLILILG